MEGGEVCLFQATTYLICSATCVNGDVIHTHFLTPVGAPQVNQLLYRSSALPKLTQIPHARLPPAHPTVQKAGDAWTVSDFPDAPPPASLGLRSCMSGKVQ